LIEWTFENPGSSANENGASQKVKPQVFKKQEGNKDAKFEGRIVELRGHVYDLTNRQCYRILRRLSGRNRVGEKYAFIQEHEHLAVAAKKAKERYLAVAFVIGSDRVRYGRLIGDLENSFIQGDDKCPTELTEAYKYNILLLRRKQDPRVAARGGFSREGVAWITKKEGSISPVSSATRKDITQNKCLWELLQRRFAKRQKNPFLSNDMLVLFVSFFGTLTGRGVLVEYIIYYYTTSAMVERLEWDDIWYRLAARPAKRECCGNMQ
jgi:hypothetical protein